jgi:hypothetical protein
MNELNLLVAAIRAAGANPIQISNANRSHLGENMDSLDKQAVPPGEYVVADIRVLIPVEK